METTREFLKLGLFMPNCSYLSAISTYRTVPDEWPYSTNKTIALAAEAAGFDMLFPVSRWRGFGGETNYMGISLETTTWAAGLLEATSRINISPFMSHCFTPRLWPKWVLRSITSVAGGGGSISSVAGAEPSLT